MSQPESSTSKVAIVTAVIAAVGGWGTTAITNWDKLFPPSAATPTNTASNRETLSDATKSAATRSIARALSFSSDVGDKTAFLENFPGLTAEEVRYRGLRKGVFLQVLAFRANGELLAESLNVLKRQGERITDADIARVVADLPSLLRMKLQWLRGEAIPKLTSYMQTKRAMIEQRTPAVEVALPESLWILPGTKSMTYVTDLPSLEEEIKLLEATL